MRHGWHDMKVMKSGLIRSCIIQFIPCNLFMQEAPETENAATKVK